MKVFIKNLPADATEAELQHVFQTHGDIASVFIGPVLSNVDYVSMDAARAAIAAWNGVLCAIDHPPQH